MMRSITLARALRQSGEIGPQFVTWSPDGLGKRKIEEFDFAVREAAGPSGSEVDLSRTTELLERETRSNCGRPAIFIADSRDISSAYLRRCESHAYVVQITDEQPADRSGDAVILISPDVEKAPATTSGRHIMLSGPAYNLLRDEFFSAHPGRSGARPTVLVTFGGEDPHNHSAWVCEKLGDLLADCDVTIVVGAAHPAPDAVRMTAAIHMPHARIVFDTPHMAEHMSAADIAITAAGTTCYELAAMGVAQILIVIEDHQRRFAEQMRRKGCAVIGGDYRLSDARPLRSEVQDLLASPTRCEEMSAAGKRLFREPGAHRITAALLQHYEFCLAGGSQVMRTAQMDVWLSDFGAEYSRRNTFADADAFNQHHIRRFGRSRDDLNIESLAGVDRGARVLEVGANIGNQLRSLQRIGFTRLYGIELQRSCVEKAKGLSPEIDIIEGTAQDIPFRDGFFDLVYTSNVLIHIGPTELPQVMSEMHRVTRRYIWGFEYFATEFTEIPYRGHENLMWKGDYCGMFQERFDDLELVQQSRLDYLDEPGNVDSLYLLQKRQS